MSLSWADPVSLTLLDDTICLRRQARVTPPASADTLLIRHDSQDVGELILAAERQMRDRPAWQRPGRLTVVLGNSRVRYAALPWVDDFMRREERLAYARIAMGKQFGARAEHWDIRLSEADYGEPWLASGCERALLERLDAFALARRWPLVSVQPALMTVANAFAARLSHGAVRLILVEPARVVCARLDNGRWQQVRTRRLSGTGRDALADLIAQETILDPDDAGSTSRLCVWAFSAPREQCDAWRAMGAEMLEGGVGDDFSPWRM